MRCWIASGHSLDFLDAELSPARRRELKARAHVLDPVVLIGAEGLSSSFWRKSTAA